MGFLKPFIFIILVLGCSQIEKKQPKPDAVEYKQLLTAKYSDVMQASAAGLDSKGWLVTDCDGMLWTSKYHAASCGQSFQIEAAEFQEEPGRFRRRPERCWTKAEGDVGSKSTWSRDMFIGMLTYAYRCNRLDILERHADYGKKKNWVMGEPFADGRTVYTPQTIGLLYQTIKALGGEDSPNRLWPTLYQPGLTDYQAHLQMLTIWLRSEIKQETEATLKVNTIMRDRIIEHHNREPDNPFYAFMHASYVDGDFELPIKLLLHPSNPVGEYVRCHEFERCRDAEWLFTTSLVLEAIQ